MVRADDGDSGDVIEERRRRRRGHQGCMMGRSIGANLLDFEILSCFKKRISPVLISTERYSERALIFYNSGLFQFSKS
jgi:hypothetical protein